MPLGNQRQVRTPAAEAGMMPCRSPSLIGPCPSSSGSSVLFEHEDILASHFGHIQQVIAL